MPNKISPLLREHLDQFTNPKHKKTLLALLADNPDPSEEEIRRALKAMGVKFYDEEKRPANQPPLTPEQEKELDRELIEQIKRWRRRAEEISQMNPEEQEKHFYETLALNRDLSLYEFLMKRRGLSSTD